MLRARPDDHGGDQDDGVDEPAEPHADVLAAVALAVRPSCKRCPASSGEGKKALIFALTRNSNEAVEWAERTGMSLFEFDYAGGQLARSLYARPSCWPPCVVGVSRRQGEALGAIPAEAATVHLCSCSSPVTTMGCSAA